jgi:hypothetical protein
LSAAAPAAAPAASSATVVCPGHAEHCSEARLPPPECVPVWP